MENGAVYRPTTEEDPGPARGARSGLAAYCNLGRLPVPQRVLKGLQLVSPGRGERAGRRGGLRARSWALGLWAGEAARRFHTRVPAAATPAAMGGPWPPGGSPAAMGGR